ncbi:nuclear transport factor 2 family protein [Flavobacterium sp. LB1P71]|uniref:nuclear transport factor 2 family protein n=1 Tax=unclassified Flavobacterium TaxID=196869 RepID=UPI003AAF89E9
MKKNILAFALMTLCLSVNAQKMNNDNKKIAVIEDRIALKNVVDTFSVLADVKDVKNQVLLFTENAEVSSINNGQIGTIFTGRKQIGEAFAGFLNLFDVVYHINGQQTVTLNGNMASGISYCQVVLIGTENNKKMKTTMGVIYHDDYVKENGHWLINKRQSNFTWTEKTEMKP